MKIKIKQIKSEEVLQKFGNRFFTKEQINDIASA
jgi:hypothetical protein